MAECEKCTRTSNRKTCETLRWILHNMYNGVDTPLHLTQPHSHIDTYARTHAEHEIGSRIHLRNASCMSWIFVLYALQCTEPFQVCCPLPRQLGTVPKWEGSLAWCVALASLKMMCSFLSTIAKLNFRQSLPCTRGWLISFSCRRPVGCSRAENVLRQMYAIH